MNDATQTKAVATLNKILEMELAGAIHYTHYSFMVYGYNRIPIVNWLEQQATESINHARAAGELVTQLGAHPSLAIGPLLETHKHDIGDILRESLSHEKKTLIEYEKLLELAQGQDVMTDRDEFVEIQGTAERFPFSATALTELLELGKHGIHELIEIQRKILHR